MEALLAKETKELDIRKELRNFAFQEQLSPDSVFLEEFALYGGGIRADVAVLNAVSHGYEIKSGRDTLGRLPRQVEAYNDVFEFATLVAAECHLAKASTLIPEWWGIVSVTSSSAGLCLTRVRPALLNPAPDPRAIAALLWRPEALQILSSYGLDAGLRSKPMFDLIERLVQALSPDLLSRLVRQTLRARGDWRAAARRKRCDDRFRQHANWWRCRRAPYASRLR